MKAKHLAVGLALAAALPATAMAQDPGCVRSNDNSKTTGTVLGAGAGALAGGLIGGNALGAVVGGLAGGVIGNRAAAARNDPCPTGYYSSNSAYYNNGATYSNGNANYSNGNYSNGNYSNGTYSNGAYAGGAYTAPPPNYEYGYGNDFWRGAPTSAMDRMAWLQQRIDRSRATGAISPAEADRIERDLVQTRRYMDRTQRRYGSLRPEDQSYVQQRLDYVSRSIRWARNNG